MNRRDNLVPLLLLILLCVMLFVPFVVGGIALRQVEEAPQITVQPPVQGPPNLGDPPAIRSVLRTVHIYQENRCGSGFPIARVGTKVAILTARHVTQALGADFLVRTTSGTILPRIGLAMESQTRDMAIFWVIGDLEPLEMAPLRIGLKVIAAGYPMCEGLNISEGYIGGDAFGMQMSSAQVFFGMSGGPIVDPKGDVVAMVVGIGAHDGMPISLMSLSLPLVPEQDWIARAVVDTFPK